MFCRHPATCYYDYAALPSHGCRPTTVMYVVEGDKGAGGSSGLSAGAIAGIVVGSVALAAAVAGLAWWRRSQLRQKRRWAGARGQEAGKCDAEAAGKASAGISNGLAGDGELPGSGSPSPNRVAPLPPVSASPHSSGLSSEHSPLPELVLHVEEHDAAAARSQRQAAAAREHVLVSDDTLPPRLREWVVSPSAVEYLRWPNGSAIEIGRGASARVYKALLNGGWGQASGVAWGGFFGTMWGHTPASWPGKCGLQSGGLLNPVVGVPDPLQACCAARPLSRAPHAPCAAGETVAAKEVDIGQSLTLQEAFITECLRLQQLRHPNIVQLMGVAVSGTKGVVLLEYAEGKQGAGSSHSPSIATACTC